MCFERMSRLPSIDEVLKDARQQGDRFVPTMLYKGDERALLLSENDGWQYVYTKDGQEEESFEPQQATCWASPTEKEATRQAALGYLFSRGFTLPAEEATGAEALTQEPSFAQAQ